MSDGMEESMINHTDVEMYDKHNGKATSWAMEW